MKKMIVAGLAILACAASMSVAQTPKPSKQLQKLMAMTPSEFATCAKLSDDSLDVIATITTEPCFKETRGLLKIVWNDNFIRAHIDKKTGVATYQVYQFISYHGEWRFYQTVNYEAPGGPRSVPVREIARNVDSCSGGLYSSGCNLSEHIAFDVDEALLREIARYWRPGAMSAWRFKFGAKAAEDWQDGISPAEVAGILAAVDGYKAAHHMPK